MRSDPDDADLADALERALSGSTSVVGVGIEEELLPSVLAARRRSDGGTWLLCSPGGVVESLGRSFVLGTAAATSIEAGGIAIRTPKPGSPSAEDSGSTTADGPGSTAGDGASAARDDDHVAHGHESRAVTDRTYFVADDRVHAIVGPAVDRSIVTTAEAGTVDGLRAAATARFDAARPSDVDMPARDRMYRTARERLGERFAADLESVLDGLESDALDRSQQVTDLTVLVALGARHDHLFHDVRTWAESMGIAPRQAFTADRRALVACGAIEAVKVPLGVGHPNYRLRAVDDRLLRVPAEGIVAFLRDRLDGVDVDDLGGGDEVHRPDDDRPVWDRRS